MARIIVVGVLIPFTRGGADALNNSLVQALKARGHEVELVQLPFNVTPKERLLEQYELFRAYDFSSMNGQKIDLVIATKYPGYMVRHPKKSIWLVHQHRAMYDAYGGRYSDFSDDPRDEEMRAMIKKADELAFHEASYLSAISKTVAKRVEIFHGMKAHVHYPPIAHGNIFEPGEYGDYILSANRLCAIKRIDLMIKALPMIHRGVTLKLVGLPDEPTIMDYYNSEIEKHHLQDRVQFCGRVSEADLISLYGNALGVYYGAYDEDYGYGTLEAFASAKPIITCRDSGGPLEFVQHDVNGLITEPTSDSISQAVNKLYEDKALARRLGQHARKDVEALSLLGDQWDDVVNGLLSPLQE